MIEQHTQAGSGVLVFLPCYSMHPLSRSMQPENLLLSRSPNDSLTLKLIDFGSAHDTQLAEAPREYISPEFLPPEVLGRESPSSCPVSDMWSVGVVTYVM